MWRVYCRQHAQPIVHQRPTRPALAGPDETARSTYPLACRVIDPCQDVAGFVRKRGRVESMVRRRGVTPSDR